MGPAKSEACVLLVDKHTIYHSYSLRIALELLFIDIACDPIFTCLLLQFSWPKPQNKYLVWEIGFAVFISISGLVLFSFLIGNMQVGFEHFCSLSLVSFSQRKPKNWVNVNSSPILQMLKKSVSASASLTPAGQWIVKSTQETAIWHCLCKTSLMFLSWKIP